jgi:hypothetical protein
VLGEAYYRAGNWSGAVKALEFSTDGQNAEAAFFLAMAHWEWDDKEQACKWYDQAERWAKAKKTQNEGLLRSRAEAAALLGVEGKSELKQPE